MYWEEEYVVIQILNVGTNKIAAANGTMVQVSMFVCLDLACDLRIDRDLQMGIYAGLGVAQAVTFFMMGASFAILTYLASKELHSVRISVFLPLRMDGDSGYIRLLLKG